MSDAKSPIPEARPFYLPSGPAELEGIDLTDLSWVGANGEVDPAETIQGNGYEPEVALELLVKAIIAASRPDETADQAWATEARTRQRQALSALTGVPIRGREQADDYDLLITVAHRFLDEFWAPDAPRGTAHKGGPWEPEIAPIVRSLIPDDHPLITERNAKPESLRQLMEQKFRRNKRVLLVRAASDQNDDRMDQRRRLKKALAAALRAGIPCDPSVVPEARVRDRNGPI